MTAGSNEKRMSVAITERLVELMLKWRTEDAERAHERQIEEADRVLVARIGPHLYGRTKDIALGSLATEAEQAHLRECKSCTSLVRIFKKAYVR